MTGATVHPTKISTSTAFQLNGRAICTLPGTYRFTATMDDGMRVFVDNNPVIDVWYDGQEHTVTADVPLSGGNHDIRVKYYEAGGEAVARVNWALVSGGTAVWRAEYSTIPPSPAILVVVRDEGQINHTWTGSPVSGVPGQSYPVLGALEQQFVAGCGRLPLLVTADDGVRLWVNNQLVLDQWRDQPATPFTVNVSVAGGAVPVRMEHYDNGGTAIAALTWAKISGSPAPAPQPPTISPVARRILSTMTAWLVEPVVVRNDSAIDFVWGSSSPIPNTLDSDRFSVRWTQTVNLPAGQYTFTANSDDGVRVWVNGQQIINAWNIHNVQAFSGAINLPGGPVEIRMEYFEYTGLAEARLTWSQIGSGGGAAPGGSGTPPTGSGVPGTAIMSGALYLTVRSGPTWSDEPVGYLSSGQTVTLLGRDAFTVWVKVREADGTEGWSSARYLNASSPLSNLPVLNE